MTPTIFQTAVVAFALVGSATATPTAKVYPEFTQLPGMPTLASLNLTVEDLYTKPVTLGEISESAVLYDNHCINNGAFGGPVDDVIACFNYINAFGGSTSACKINSGPGGSKQLCHIGRAYVFGDNGGQGSSANSACSDVAIGVQWIFTNCNFGGKVEGNAAARGNGDYVVIVEGSP